MTTNLQLHSLAWENYNPDILNAHQKVMRFFDLDVQYTQKTIQHGQWLDQVIGQSQAEVIGIIEPDLIPLNRAIVDASINYVLENDSFIGCAQVSNHKYPGSHIFAAPSYFFITRACYERLGKPSFRKTRRADVAENVSYKAEKLGIRYRTLFPTHFEREPREGCWPLASYGLYGVGTVFADSIYHLFQGRFADNRELFIKRCEEVMAGQFSTEGFHSSTALQRAATLSIVPVKQRRWYKLHQYF